MRTATATQINCRDVEKLTTTFFYRDQDLHFMILLKMKNRKVEVYREFDDYQQYYVELQELLAKMGSDHMLRLDPPKDRPHLRVA